MKAKTMKSVRLHKLIHRVRLDRALVLVLLLILVGIGAVPGYWTGNWSWAELPKMANFNQIKNLQKTGLELPGWQTLEQTTANLGGHKWSYQVIEGDYPRPIMLLLRPPNDNGDQPQVEWMDIDGTWQWKTDSHTRLKFTVDTSASAQPTGTSKPTPPTAEVEARFFRTYPRPELTSEQLQTLNHYYRQTFAVVQWYAWPGGGHPAPSHWFWTDQFAQLRRNRVPWVAVSLQIPIEPLGDLEASRPLAESLSKMVQTSLMVGSFAGDL